MGEKLGAPRDVAAWMGAIQAQDFGMALWGIDQRLSDGANRAVLDAFNAGAFLRTHVLRPTWHFVAPENIRWMLTLSARRIKVSAQAWGRHLGIGEELYCKSNRIIEKALENGVHLTREALGQELEHSGIVVDASRLVHFTMWAELEGIVCSGALQGKKQTYALLDERAPQAELLTRDESLAKLARIYFTSHGPATLQDFVWWSGLSQAEARRGMEAVASELASEVIGGQSYLFAYNSSSFVLPKNTLHLLPAFDEYLVSYKDRSAVLSPAQHHKAISSNGIFRPTVVVDGSIVGLWKKTNTKTRPIDFDFFKKPSAATLRKAEKATDGYREFLLRNN
ncbi:MAG: winged helix DNA-binding domain-containing protein [Coriobacteriales bacterium]|nr:winged helix DNA-binding domain-containing protein [Coriobacteriales bacterium]